MSATTSSHALPGDHHRAYASRTDPLIRRRRLTALALTLFAAALGALLIFIAGRDAVVIYFFQLPVALALLWASTSDKRFDEVATAARGARNDNPSRRV